MSALPNPDVYLNHIPPDQATQFEATRNLCLAVLGATLWDILVYIPEDIKIVRRGPINVAVGCFIFSRVFAMLFILLAVITQTHALANCDAIVVIGVMILFATTCTTFLFLQRLRAVYADNKWVQAAFWFLWVATCGVMTTTVYGAKAAHIPGTGYCIYTKVERYMGAAGFMSSFFDTAVFVAISYKIGSSHNNLGSGISWSTLISGRALPQLSKSILQGGQQYYFITVCISFPVGVIIAVPQTPPIYKLILSFALVPLSASMACRVFRNIKLHDLSRPARAALSDVNFAPRQGHDLKSGPNHSHVPHPNFSLGTYGSSSSGYTSSGGYMPTIQSTVQDITHSRKIQEPVEISLPHRSYGSNPPSDGGHEMKDLISTNV